MVTDFQAAKDLQTVELNNLLLTYITSINETGE